MYAPADHSVNCPRCGYDQRGLVATWVEFSPLEATCTECGLVYSCAEVHCPEKFEPTWCVEYCEGTATRLARASLGTLARSFLPWRFWSRLKMSHRIQPRRIALYVLILLAPLLLIYISVQTLAALHGRAQVQAQLAQVAASDAYILSFEPGAIALPPAQVQRYQAWYGPRWEEMVSATIRHLEAQRPDAERRRDDPPRIRGTVLHAIFEAIVLPAARSSRITIDNAPPYVTYIAPIELVEHWSDMIGQFVAGAGGGVRWGWWTAYGWISAAPIAALGLLCSVALHLAFPLSLVLLPLSRRRAKVRWAHIGRITAYGLFIPTSTVLLMVLLSAATVLLAIWGTALPGSGWAMVFLGVGAIPLGTMLWWCFAINRHLKMPHALAVTAILMFVSFLALVAAAYFLTPRLLFGGDVN